MSNYTLPQSVLDNHSDITGGYRTNIESSIARAEGNPLKMAAINALLTMTDWSVGIGNIDSIISRIANADPFDAQALGRIFEGRIQPDSLEAATILASVTPPTDLVEPPVVDTDTPPPPEAPVIDERTIEPTHDLAPATYTNTPEGQLELIATIRAGFLYGKLEPARSSLSGAFDAALAAHGGIITPENYQSIADAVVRDHFGIALGSPIEPGSEADAFRYDLEVAAAANLNIEGTATAFQEYMRDQFIRRWGEDQVGKGGVLDSLLADVGMLTPTNINTYLQTRSEVSTWFGDEYANTTLADSTVWVLATGTPADVRAMVDQIIGNPEALEYLASNHVFAAMDEATLQALLTPNEAGEYQDFYEHPLVNMLRNMPTGDSARLIAAMREQGIVFDAEVEQLMLLANYSADIVVYASQFNEALARGPGAELDAAVAGLNADIVLSANADFDNTPAGLAIAAQHGGMDETAQAYDRVMQVLQTIPATQIPALVEALDPAAREALLTNPDFFGQLSFRQVSQEDVLLLRETLGLTEDELASGDSLAEVLARADYADRLEDASLNFYRLDTEAKIEALDALLDMQAILADGTVDEDEQARLADYAANPALAGIFAMAFVPNAHGEVVTYSVRDDMYQGLVAVDIGDAVAASIDRLAPDSLASLLTSMDEATRTAFLANAEVQAALAAAGLDGVAAGILRDVNGGLFIDEQLGRLGLAQDAGTEGTDSVNAQTAEAVREIYRAVMGQNPDVDASLMREELLERLEANPALADSLMQVLTAEERASLIGSLTEAAASQPVLDALLAEHASQTATEWVLGLDMSNPSAFAQALMAGPAEDARFGVEARYFHMEAMNVILSSADGLEGFMRRLSPDERSALLADADLAPWQAEISALNNRLNHETDVAELQGIIHGDSATLADGRVIENNMALLAFLVSPEGSGYAAEVLGKIQSEGDFHALVEGLSPTERVRYFGSDDSLARYLPDLGIDPVGTVQEQAADYWLASLPDDATSLVNALIAIPTGGMDGVPADLYYAAAFERISLQAVRNEDGTVLTSGIERFMGELDAQGRATLMENPEFSAWLGTQPAETHEAFDSAHEEFARAHEGLDNQARAAWAEYLLTTGNAADELNFLGMPTDLSSMVSWLENGTPEDTRLAVQERLIESLTAVDIVLIRGNLTPEQRDVFERTLGDEVIAAPNTLEEAITSLMRSDANPHGLELPEGQDVAGFIALLNSESYVPQVERLEYDLITAAAGSTIYNDAIRLLSTSPDLAVGLAYNLTPAQFQLLVNRMPASDREAIFGGDLSSFYSINQARAIGDGTMTVSAYLAELDKGSNSQILLEAIANPSLLPVTLYGVDASIDSTEALLAFLAENGDAYGALVLGRLDAASFGMMLGSSGESSDFTLTPGQILAYFGPDGSLTGYLPEQLAISAATVSEDLATGQWFSTVGTSPAERAAALIALDSPTVGGIALEAYFRHAAGQIANGVDANADGMDDGIYAFMTGLSAEQRNALLADEQFAASAYAAPFVDADAALDEAANGLALISSLGRMSLEGVFDPAIALEGVEAPYQSIATREALLDFLVANPNYAQAMLGQMTVEQYELFTANMSLTEQAHYFGNGGLLSDALAEGIDATGQIAAQQLIADGAMVRAAIIGGGEIGEEGARRFDRNGDGLLSVMELQLGMAQYGYDAETLLEGLEAATLTGWAGDDRIGLRGLLQGTDLLAGVDGIYASADADALMVRLNDDASGLSAEQIMAEIVRFSQAQPTAQAQAAMFESLIGQLDESFLNALSASSEGDLDAAWAAIVAQVPETWRRGEAWDAFTGHAGDVIASRENTILHNRALQANFGVDVEFDEDGTLPDDLEAYLAGTTTINGVEVPNAHLVLADQDVMIDDNGDGIPDGILENAFAEMGRGNRLLALETLAEAVNDATPELRVPLEATLGELTAQHLTAELDALAMGVYQSLNGTDRAGNESFFTIPVFSRAQAGEIVYALATGGEMPAHALQALAGQFPVPPFHDANGDGVADELAAAWDADSLQSTLLGTISQHLDETGAYSLMMYGGLSWEQRTALLDDQNGMLLTTLGEHNLLDDLAKGDFHRFQNELLREAWNNDGTSLLDGSTQWPAGSGESMMLGGIDGKEGLVEQLLAGNVPDFLEERYAPFGGLEGFGSAFVDEGAVGIENDAADMLLCGLMFHVNEERLATLFATLTVEQIEQLLATTVTFDGQIYSVEHRLREIMDGERNMWDIAQELKDTHNETVLAVPEVTDIPSTVTDNAEVAPVPADAYVLLITLMNENPGMAHMILTGRMPEGELAVEAARLRGIIDAEIPGGLDYNRFLQDPSVTGLLNNQALANVMFFEMVHEASNPGGQIASLQSLSALAAQGAMRPDFDQGLVTIVQSIVREQACDQLEPLLLTGVIETAEDLALYNQLRALPEIQAILAHPELAARFEGELLALPDISDDTAVPYVFSDADLEQMDAIDWALHYYSGESNAIDARNILSYVANGSLADMTANGQDNENTVATALITEALRFDNDALFRHLALQVSQTPDQAYPLLTTLPYELHIAVAGHPAFINSLNQTTLDTIVAGYHSSGLLTRTDLTPREQVGVVSSFAGMVAELRQYSAPYSDAANQALATGHGRFLELSNLINDTDFLTQIVTTQTEPATYDVDTLLQLERAYREVFFEGGFGSLTATDLFATLDAYHSVIQMMEAQGIEGPQLDAARDRRDQIIADHLDMFEQIDTPEALQARIDEVEAWRQEALARGDEQAADYYQALAGQVAALVPSPNTYMVLFPTPNGPHLYTFENIIEYPSFQDYMTRHVALDEHGRAEYNAPDERSFQQNLDEDRITGMMADNVLSGGELSAILAKSPDLQSPAYANLINELMEQLVLGDDVETAIMEGSYTSTLDFANALLNYGVIDQGDVTYNEAGQVVSINMSGIERAAPEAGINQQ
jgi:hypothetical protein